MSKVRKSPPSVNSFSHLNRNTEAEQKRDEIRSYIKNETHSMSKLWMVFKEKVKSEEAKRDKSIQIKIKELNRILPESIQQFITMFKHGVRNIMRDKGGSAHTIIRDMFIYWDPHRSGKVTTTDVKGILKSVNVYLSTDLEREVFKFYSESDNVNEFFYRHLLSDILRDEPKVVDFVTDNEVVMEKDLVLQEINRPLPSPPLIVAQFIEVLQQYISDVLRDIGGSPYSICHDLMLKFDNDRSNGFNPKELQALCARALKLNITLAQSTDIVRYYSNASKQLHKGDKNATNSDEMHLDVFYSSLSIGKQPLLHNSVDTVRSMEKTRQSFASNPLLPKQFHSQPNKVLEKFKLNAKALIAKRLQSGNGSLKSILLEAFTAWDHLVTRKLSRLDHILGAVKKIGFDRSQATNDLAEVLLKAYDVNGTGEMHYMLLIDELTREDSHFMTHNITPTYHGNTAPAGFYTNRVSVTARIPSNASKCLVKVKTALEAYVRKSKGSLLPKDILHGTCLRFDTDKSGYLTTDQLQNVFQELKANISDVTDVTAFIAWYDTNGSRRFDYNSFIREVYGDDVTLSLTKKNSLVDGILSINLNWLPDNS